jgi:hypothetical protein
MPHNNPFIYSTPVTPEQLIGREQELFNIAGRISTGQSSAIMGSPRSGKTSMLEYLRAPETQATLYNDETEQLIFSYLDISTWGARKDKTQFWDYALKPLQDYLSPDTTPPSLLKAYQICQENQFGTYVLEKLLAQMKLANWRLVLMVDGFDVLLHHPILNDVEFFGGLRTLASRFSALALVVTTNIRVSQLEKETQHYSRAASPYFNFLEEIVLGPLPDAEIDKLLVQEGTHFSDDDLRFIKEIAGGHPYLLQIAASVLWYLYESGEKDSVKRQQRAGQEFYNKVEDTLKNIWQLSLQNTQETFISIVLAHIKDQPHILLTSTIDINELQKAGIDIEKRIAEINAKPSEINELQKYGFIVKNECVLGGWQIYPQIFLAFVIKNKLYGVRDKQSPQISEVSTENDDILEKLFTPRFLIFMFMGVVVGEQLGDILTNEDFGFLSLFSGGSPFSIDMVKFCCAMLGGFFGYKLALAKNYFNWNQNRK